MAKGRERLTDFLVAVPERSSLMNMTHYIPRAHDIFRGTTLSVLLGIVSASVVAAALPAQFTYKTVGDRKLVLHVSYPSDWKPADHRAAIVFFFGGGWTNGKVEQFLPQATYLAKRGMVAVRADYRVKSRDNVTPDKCVEDAISAIRWVRGNAKRLGIDPNRIVASGGSAGGHLAACTYFTEGINAPTDDLNVSHQPNAMILFNPALDFIGLAESDRKQHAKGLDRATMLKLSPLRLMQTKFPPTLILDGTADFLYDQNKAFVDKGKKLGAPVEVYLAEGVKHGFC